MLKVHFCHPFSFFIIFFLTNLFPNSIPFIGLYSAAFTRFLLDDFAKYGVNTDHVVEVSGCSCPTSCVVLSQATGSRTIIHANAGLPELSVDDFSKVDLTNFSWIHFEVRYTVSSHVSVM